jgi:hypothetical protein
MTALSPRPGFDWNHVAWSRSDSAMAPFCSYCSAPILDETVPLIVFTKDSHAAQFCDACMTRWWGMR